MDLSRLHEAAFEYDQSDDLSPLGAALADAIAQAPDAASVWEALSLDGIGDLVFGDKQLPEAVITAIMRRALERPDAEILGIASRLASYEPAELAAEGSGWKSEVRSAIGAHAGPLREAWGAAPAQLRAQIAHALAVGEAATPADATRLGALLSDSPDPEVLGLGLLACAATKGEDQASLLHANLTHESPLVRLMAAVGVGLAGEPLNATASEALQVALVAEQPLPPWWAFRTFDQNETSAALALRVLHWAKVEDPGPLVEVIAARSEVGWWESEILQSLAFVQGVDPLGVVASELTAPQHTALAAHGGGSLAALPGGLHRFGLARAEDVEPFLAERGPLWSLRPVALEHGTARWPAVRVWKARVWGAISEQAAVDALTQPLAPADLLELTCTRWRGVLLQCLGQSRGDQHELRDHALIIAALRIIDDSDFDLAAAVTAKLGDPDDSDPLPLTAAALIVLANTPLVLAREHWGALARGVQIAKQHECFAELLNATPESVRHHMDQALA